MRWNQERAEVCELKATVADHVSRVLQKSAKLLARDMTSSNLPVEAEGRTVMQVLAKLDFVKCVEIQESE